MRNETRLLFTGMIGQLATINGVAAADVRAGAEFSIAPAVEQKLEEIIKQETPFLQQVNVYTVVAQEGDKIGLGVTRPIAGRVATNSQTGVRRRPTDPTDTADRGRYRCEQTNSDVALKYAKIDQWRHRPEFQTLWRDVIAKQQGRDRIMVAWNGVNCAATTDVEAFPLLQDVNYGWLYKIRTFAAERVLDDGALTTGDAAGTKAVYVAPGVEVVDRDASNTATAEADYTNLDALVTDATMLLDEWHRTDTDLVVIVGFDLVHDKVMGIINAAGDTATEQEARNRLLALPTQIGGKRAIVVPFFPPDAVLITSLDNLSIYVQENTRRRAVKDAPEYNEVQDFSSVNECYVVEDYGRCALVENIRMRKKPAAA